MNKPLVRALLGPFGTRLRIVTCVAWAILLFPIVVSAQWIQKYTSTAQSGNNQLSFSGEVMAKTSDGGSIVADRAYGPANDRNIAEPSGVGLFKLNSNGTIAWQKIYVPASWTGSNRPPKPSGAPEYRIVTPTAIQQTSDGGYVLSMAVTVLTFNSQNQTYSESPASVLKLNSDGNIEWWRTYGYGPLASAGITLTSIQEVPGGYVAGGVYGFTAAWLKLTLTGTIEWLGLLPDTISVDPLPSDVCYVRRTNDGGYIFASGYSAFSHAIRLGKLNADGSYAWVKNVVMKSSFVRLASVQQTSDGGYFLAGGISGTASAFGVKFLSNGVIDWQKSYGNANAVAAAQQTSDGGYVIGGSNGVYPNANASLLKLDSGGEPAWERKYSQDTGFNSIEQTGDGGFVAVGGSLQGLPSKRQLFSIDANGNALSCGNTVSSTVTPISFEVETRIGGGSATGNTGEQIFVDTFGTQTIDVNTTIETVCGVQSAQLEMTKLAPSTATVGQDLTYTILIKNKGPAIAQAVTLTDPLSSSVAFVSVNSTQGTCAAGNPVTCNLGDLANSATATVTLVVRPNVEGQLANLATVSAANSLSLSASASSTVGAASKTVQFNATSYSVGEGSQRIDVIVTRSGDLSAAAAVSFATSDTAGANACTVVNGAASSRCDYLSAQGTLNFTAGESSKTISLLITDDTYVEGAETFSVNLSNAAGASLGSPANVTITINDNDSANGANPIDSASFFVRQHYLDFLNREPDSSGLAFWTNEITSCGTNQSCIETKRVNVSGAFFLSIEFQQTGYLVERVYKAAYGDGSGSSTLNGAHMLPVPIVRFNEFLMDTQRIGQGVVVGQSGWEAVLENNKAAFASEFVQRSRFANAYATTMSPAALVDALFAKAGVTPTTAERNAAIAEFGAATNTSDITARGRVLRRVAENSALQTNEFNRAFVLMQFFGYLRRDPNSTPDSDYTGYDFWLTKLNQFNGNYQNAEMVKAFISSTEYRQRFGTP